MLRCCVVSVGGAYAPDQAGGAGRPPAPSTISLVLFRCSSYGDRMGHVNTTTEVRPGPDGPEVVRVAGDDAGRAALAREAERLGRARHPGVVELRSVSVDELVMAWAGAETLATFRLPIAEAAGLLVSVSETVADLHRLGLVHGRLDPSHVVIGRDGRPRLCGMRGPDPGATQVGPADDVAALGRLIDHVVGTEAEGEPIPERRWGRPRWTGYHRRALQTLADGATDPDPAARPTARELARRIAEAVPDALLPAPAPPDPPPVDDIATDDDVSTRDEVAGDDDPAEDEVIRDEVVDDPAEEDGGPISIAPSTIAPPPPAPVPAPEAWAPEPPPVTEPPVAPPPGPVPPRSPRGGTGRPRALLVIVSAGAAVIVALGARILLADDGRSGPLERVAPPASDAAPPPTTCDPAPVPTAADLDGDGCPDPYRIDDTTIRALGRTYEVGRVGDHVQVGDWDCDGRSTVGVVRPSTGEVFLFDGWDLADGPVTVRAADVVDGAQRLRVGTEPACLPVAIDRSGAPTPLHVQEPDR